jgi:hypothetical protein
MNNTFYLKTHPFSLINNTRGNSWPIYSAVAELIDNSIDASASNIDIEILNDSIVITDNGKGFTYSELISAFETISCPPPENTDIRIGRYNTGMKTASVRIGDSLTILTKTLSGDGYSFYVDWDKVCNFNQPITKPKSFKVSFKHGTQITINRLFQFDKRAEGNITYNIRKLYSRYLNGGGIIKYNGDTLTGLPKINLLKEFVLNGEDYTIKYGFYDNDKIKESDWRFHDVIGVHIYYRGRLFHMPREQRTSIPIKFDRYYIEINTDNAAYGPNVHKDGLIYLNNILTDKVISVINSNLSKEYDKLESEEDKKIQNALNDMFKNVAKKQKRDKNGDELSDLGQGRKNGITHDKPGTIVSKDSDIKRETWNKGDNATTKHKIRSKECDFSKIDVVYAESTDTYGWASVDLKTGVSRVYLDWKTSSYAQSLTKRKDKSSLFYLAISILAEEWVKQIDVTESVQQFIYKHTNKYL